MSYRFLRIGLFHALINYCDSLPQVKVFFVDYGNVETITLSNLHPLHPKFTVYPFQCCFSSKSELVYKREVNERHGVGVVMGVAWKLFTGGSRKGRKWEQGCPQKKKSRVVPCQLT